MLALPDPAELEELIAVATDDEKAALTELLEMRLSLESPLAFAMRVSPGTQPFPHTVLLDQYLVALCDHALYHRDSKASALRPDLPVGISDKAEWEWDLEGLADENRAGRFVHPETREECVYNLAISMPPQHGKSYLVSHHLPAWYLIRYPDRNAAVVSYEHDFASSWTSKVRTLIEQHPEYGVYLDPSTKAKGLWNTTVGGGLMAAGVGGPLTGRPLYLTVMDDLIKNSIEALSETTLQVGRDWWHTTAKTRNQSPRFLPGWEEPAAGVRVLMHTRWSEQDLIGYVQLAEPDEWFLLNLPAISEGTDPDSLPEGHHPDPLGRPKGAALAPSLHSLSVLENIKKSGDPEDPHSGGAFWFEANYQGYPNVEGQGIFSRPFNVFEQRGPKMIFPPTPEHKEGYVCYETDLRRFVTIDLADSMKKRADFTVFMELGQAPNGYLIVLDIWRDRLESPDHQSKLVEWLKTKARQMFVAIEDKTFGTVLIKGLLRNKEFKSAVRALKADTDKVTRAIPAGMACRNRKVWWCRDAEWRPRLESELTAFPNGAHDDMTDTLAYGVQVWEGLPGTFEESHQDESLAAERARKHREAAFRKKAKKRGRHPQAGRL